MIRVCTLIFCWEPARLIDSTTHLLMTTREAMKEKTSMVRRLLANFCSGRRETPSGFQ